MVTKVLQDGVELNWLPPREPNGNITFRITYKDVLQDQLFLPTGTTTGSDLHFNLTGLRNGSIYDINVQAIAEFNIASSETTSYEYHHLIPEQGWLL